MYRHTIKEERSLSNIYVINAGAEHVTSYSRITWYLGVVWGEGWSVGVLEEEELLFYIKNVGTIEFEFISEVLT